MKHLETEQGSGAGSIVAWWLAVPQEVDAEFKSLHARFSMSYYAYVAFLWVFMLVHEVQKHSC